MTISESEAHSRAIVSIQALLSKHTPGSPPYRIAERALDLAFNCSCAGGADREQELLVAAKNLIDRQVRARLLIEPFVSQSEASRQSRRVIGLVRYLAWRSALRPREADHSLVQAELQLTAEARNEDGHGCIR